MTGRWLIGSLVVVVLVILTASPVAAQDVPRVASGKPDLQGVWDFRTLTPLERPEDQAQAVLTDEEAATLERLTAEKEEHLLNRAAIRTEAGGNVDRAAAGELPDDSFVNGSYGDHWLDRGTSVIATKRTSLIIDPPNGRTPELTPEAERKRAALAEVRKGIGPHVPTPGGWVDDLGSTGLQVRCIVGFNAGPPMTPGAYNNNFQMFQTPDEVVIYNEMNHDPRVIPLDGRPFTGLRQWHGESRGHWEGDTLVVETKNFFRETAFMRGGASADLEVTERFTRQSPTVLNYEVTVSDPTTWTRPWTYEVPMQRNPESIFEFACHEGNYSMEVLLSGALAK